MHSEWSFNEEVDEQRVQTTLQFKWYYVFRTKIQFIVSGVVSARLSELLSFVRNRRSFPIGHIRLVAVRSIYCVRCSRNRNLDGPLNDASGNTIYVIVMGRTGYTRQRDRYKS